MKNFIFIPVIFSIKILSLFFIALVLVMLITTTFAAAAITDGHTVVKSLRNMPREGEPPLPSEGEPLPPEGEEPILNEGEPLPPNESEPLPPNESEPLPPNESEPLPPNESEPLPPNESEPLPPEGEEPVLNGGEPLPPNESEPLPPEGEEPILNESEPLPPEGEEPILNEGEPLPSEGEEPILNEGEPPSEGEEPVLNEGEPLPPEEEKPVLNEGEPLPPEEEKPVLNEGGEELPPPGGEPLPSEGGEPVPPNDRLTESELADLNAEKLGQLEPAKFEYLDAQKVAVIPPDAFSGITPEQMTKLEEETLEGMTSEQFKQIPPEALGGLTSENMNGLPVNIIDDLTETEVSRLNPDEFKKMEGYKTSKFFTNFNDNIDPTEIDHLIPENWKIDQETRELKVPVGTKLTLRGLPKPVDLLTQVVLPQLPDLNAGFGLGGAGTPMLEKITQSLEQAKLAHLIPSQNDNGILKIQETRGTASFQSALFPDTSNIIQVDSEQNPAKVWLSEDGFYQVTTAEGLQIQFNPAPQDLTTLSEVIGHGEIILGQRGDVMMELPIQTQEGNTFEKKIAIFNPIIEKAPDNLSPGFYPQQSDEGESAIIVYSDGTAQTVKPTVFSPDTFMKEGLKFEGVESLVFKADGTLECLYNGQLIRAVPSFDVKTRNLNEEESVESSIVANEDGTLTYTTMTTTVESARSRRTRDARQEEVVVQVLYIVIP